MTELLQRQTESMNTGGLQWWSLKARVTLTTVIILLLGIWSLAFYVSKTMRDDMERLLGGQQQATVALVGAEINSNFRERMDALKGVAVTMDSDLLNDTATLQRLIEHRPILQVLFNAGVFVTRKDGVAVAEFPLIGRIGLNYLDRDHIAAALTEGKATVGKPTVGKKVRVASFAITVPILDSHGKVIGAMAGATDLSKPNFLEGLKQSRYGQSGGYLVVDPKSRQFVVATPNNQRMVMQPIPATGVNPVLDRRLQGFDGSAVNVNSQGDAVLTSSARIAIADWFVIATIPTKEVFAPVRNMLERTAIATILLTLLAGALAWWFLKRQLTPMTRTIKTLSDLSESSMRPQPLAVTSQDEIGDLITAFNRLLGTLGSRDDALRRSDQYSRAVIESSPVALAINDDNENITYLNQAFLISIGYTLSEIPALNDWWSRACPNQQYRQYVQDSWRARQDEAGRTGKAFVPLEVNIRCKDESTRTYVCSTTLIGDALTGTHVVILYDITERKHIELAMYESEKRFHQMADSAPVLIWVAKTDKLCHWFNEVWLSFTGRTMEQEMGNGWTEGVHPDDLQRCLDTYVGAFDARQEFTMEYRLRRFDGEYRWLVDNGLPRHDDQGNFLGYIGSCIDITERKRSEALLQVSLRLREYGLSHSLDELLTKTLDEAELLTGSEIGFFHFLENDQKTLWLQDWSTRTLREMCTAEGKMQHYSVDQAGVWVDCIHERRPVIHNDYASLPHRKGLPAGHAPVKRELVVPIMRGELIVAILGVGNKAVNYDQRDVEAVSRIADIAWDVVAARRVEHELVKSRNLLAETERIGKVGGWEFDIDSGKQAWTEEVYRIHEVALDLGPTLEKGIDFYAPDCRARVQEVVRRVIEHGEPFDIDSAIITAKGNRRDVHVVGRPDLEHRRIYGFIQDITERKQMEETVRQLAFHDALTGLPNRRLLLDRLEQALTANQRNETFGALMFLDLDNFKPLNDQHGHGAGDLLLVEVAHRLRECVRAVDTVSRIGGDEFVVLVCGLTTNQTQSAGQANRLAEKICASLAQPYLLQSGSELGKIEHHCSASIGVVLIEPQHQSVEGLLKWADATMYRAKAEGRNRVNFMVERRAQQRP